jgi:hypothetical protein
MAKMAKRYSLSPEELSTPLGEVVFVMQNSIVGFLESRGMTEESKTRTVAVKTVKELQTLGLGGQITETEITLGVDGNKGTVRLTVYEARTSEDATIWFLYISDAISNMKAVVNPTWNSVRIGEIALGHKMPGGATWATTVFRRGNMVVSVLGGRRFEGQLAVDARELAARVDGYLCHLRVRPNQKPHGYHLDALGKLEIVLRDAAATASRDLSDRVVTQKEYDLSVSRASDDTRDGELRVYVEHGTSAKTPAGTLRIAFEKAGSWKIHCYRLDAEGNCIAWGVRQVIVGSSQDPPRPEP